MTIKQLIVPTLAALAVAGSLTTSAAVAADTRCEGTIAEPTVENVLVPEGATCALVGTVVRGSLECVDNDPAPVGGANTAAQKQGQCAAL